MIRRPMVWILGAFLSGLILARYSAASWLIIGIILFEYMLIYLLMYRLKNRYVTEKDRFLWLLPMLLLLGALAMKAQLELPELTQAFSQETSCELTGRITMVVTKPNGRALYLKDVTVTLPQKKAYRCEAVLAYTSDNQVYQIGNQIFLKGSLQKFRQATNPGQFDEQMYYRIENIDFKAIADEIVITNSRYSVYAQTLFRMKNRLIQVYSSMLGKKEAGALIAMLLGEKYLLDDELKELYQVNGISHILAISGLHVSLIGMSIFWLLKKCRLPLPVSTLLTIAAIYSYGVLTNFSVSTNRAVVMMVVLLLANLFGRTYDMLSATALSALLILLQNPLQLYSAGFLLSYLAVLGISLLYPGLQRSFPYRGKLLDGLLISTSATLATTPVVLFFFYQFPTYGILTNLLILPLITILTLTSLLAGVAGVFYLPLGIFLIGGPNYILKLYEVICRVNTGLPGSLITTGRPAKAVILVYFSLLLIFVFQSKQSNRKHYVILPVLGLLLLFIRPIHGGLEVTMLDVGQGESIYMECGGTNYLIDGGSTDIKNVGTYRLLPYLKYKGVDRLDYAIVTHCDEDHINGLTELMKEERFRIRRLLLPDIGKKDENYLALEQLAREKKIAVCYIKEGDRISSKIKYQTRVSENLRKERVEAQIVKNKPMNSVLDRDISTFSGNENLNIYCLYPAPDGAYDTVNSYSTVLSVSYGAFDLLLTGDLGEDGEERLRQQLSEGYYNKKYRFTPALDYDVLKVAHHGSKYSTSEDFLKLIRPDLSLISCGRNNKKVTRLIQFRFPCSGL